MYKSRKSSEANKAYIKDCLEDTQGLTKAIRLPALTSLRMYGFTHN